jgi:hypothetical protein
MTTFRCCTNERYLPSARVHFATSQVINEDFERVHFGLSIKFHSQSLKVDVDDGFDGIFGVLGCSSEDRRRRHDIAKIDSVTELADAAISHYLNVRAHGSKTWVSSGISRHYRPP